MKSIRLPVQFTGKKGGYELGNRTVSPPGNGGKSLSRSEQSALAEALETGNIDRVVEIATNGYGAGDNTWRALRPEVTDVDWEGLTIS